VFLLAETARYFLHGWIREYYLAPGLLFKYHGFAWVEPWTGEGHRFSWRMKLNDRRATARFIVTDSRDGWHWEVDPADYQRPRQEQLMATQPDMILQFAHYLAQIWKQREGIEDVEVRAEVMYSLNGRPPNWSTPGAT
jgi:hypothetical protein